MKKTKIICSIGPASVNPDVMEILVRKGMNVARTNFSHATEEECIANVASVKEVRKRTGLPVAILYDTKGPEFRNGMMTNDKITLEEGKTIRVVKEQVLGTEEQFTVNYPKAIDSINIGDVLLLENGLMSMDVIGKDEAGITCKIVNGGVLGNKKSLNVPGVHLDMPFISEQDEKDIIYACEHDGDFLALSFVSSPEDVKEARSIITAHNSNMKIISKIESTRGVKNIDAIIKESDGIMVARGDLGVEVSMAELPIIQKDIITKCREQGKICVVATEMLASMYTSSRPTRAEVSDIANAVLDGTDAVMLSGETTIGKYPVEAVNYMAETCLNTEKFINYNKHTEYLRTIRVTDTIAKSVVDASNYIGASAIVAATNSGYTAKKISNLRPACTVLAACPSDHVAQSLALNFGVKPVVVPIYNSTDDVVNGVKEVAVNTFNLTKGDTIIVAGGFPTNKDKHTTNFMKIEEIGE